MNILLGTYVFAGVLEYNLVGGKILGITGKMFESYWHPLAFNVISNCLIIAVVDLSTSTELLLECFFEAVALKEYGFPLIITVSNTDIFEEYFVNSANESKKNFIMQFMRAICLKHAISFYSWTSKSAIPEYFLESFHKNITALQDKSMTLIQQVPGKVTNSNFLAIPNGWDSHTKIDLLKSDFNSLSLCKQNEEEMRKYFYEYQIADISLNTEVSNSPMVDSLKDEQFFEKFESNSNNNNNNNNSQSVTRDKEKSNLKGISSESSFSEIASPKSFISVSENKKEAISNFFHHLMTEVKKGSIEKYGK